MTCSKMIMRDKLPAYTMSAMMFPKKRAYLLFCDKLEAPQYTLQEALENGFNVKGENYKWDADDEKKLEEFAISYSKDETLIAVQDPYYSIGHYQYEKSIPTEAVSKKVKQMSGRTRYMTNQHKEDHVTKRVQFDLPHEETETDESDAPDSTSDDE